MLQMIKMFRIIFISSIIFIVLILNAYSSIPELRPKMFLYASRLPTTIKNYKIPLQKHVIDVLLSTQKHNVVFSDIPKFISPANVPQNILKYKLERVHSPHSF